MNPVKIIMSNYGVPENTIKLTISEVVHPFISLDMHGDISRSTPTANIVREIHAAINE